MREGYNNQVSIKGQSKEELQSWEAQAIEGYNNQMFIKGHAKEELQSSDAQMREGYNNQVFIHQRTFKRRTAKLCDTQMREDTYNKHMFIKLHSKEELQSWDAQTREGLGHYAENPTITSRT